MVSQLLIKEDYKHTELGWIPKSWKIRTLGEVSSLINDGTHHTPNYVDQGVPFYSVENVTSNDFINTREISIEEHNKLVRRCKPEQGDILLTRIGTLGKTKLIDWDINASIYVSLALIKLQRGMNSKYIYSYTKSNLFVNEIVNRSLTNAVPQKINMNEINAVKIIFPDDEKEQQAIASVLTDMDELIESLEKMIDKKKKIKQGTMQQLLTGKRRLPGFSAEWEEVVLDKVITCLDHLRRPLSAEERMSIKGSIPYYGANGVVDYINDYMVDDELILIAEDGGHFEEYLTRPIAYQIKGKAWVNNHAHILKANDDVCQDYIFYSLVNKNILNHITGGTRAKLNRSELMKIKIVISKDIGEQQTIASILSDMDAEIELLEEKLEKYKQVKEGMMQQLLTGRIRLV